MAVPHQYIRDSLSQYGIDGHIYRVECLQYISKWDCTQCFVYDADNNETPRFIIRVTDSRDVVSEITA
jgi:hypothetical protein